MGIGKDIFIEPVPLDLLCNICSGVLCQPVQVHCGEDHIFCHECILPLVEQNTNNNIPCPTCNMSMNTNTLQPSKFVQRQLGRLAIRCQYQSLGCNWVGTLSSDHISHCAFKSRGCVNAERGCTQQADDKQMTQHELLCEYGVMECPNGFCSSTFLRKDLAQHESSCRSYPCVYASSGCQYIGTMPEVNDHCAIYCGRLHDRIQQLEQECIILNKQLELNNALQQPDHANYLYQSSNAQQIGDSAKLEMDPLLQMVNDTDLFNLMETNNNISNQTSINNPVMSSIASPQRNPPISNKPTSSPISSGPPKRTPKGKRIRYSKNTKLAHGALRASKSATTPGEDDTSLDYTTTQSPPVSTAIQEDVSSPASVGTPGSEDLSRLMDTLSTTSHHSPLSFNTLDDVAKFFDTLPPRTVQKKKGQASSPLLDRPQKPNPMFVLASSYLSNYK